MGMSIRVIGIRIPTADYEKKVRAYEACKEAGVAIPDELVRFFNYREPNPLGDEVDLIKNGFADPYKADEEEGYTIDIQDLPSGVRYVRFINSY